MLVVCTCVVCALALFTITPNIRTSANIKIFKPEDFSDLFIHISTTAQLH